MTRLMALWIKHSENLEILAYESEGRYGYYIGTLDQNPCGCKRIRPLVMSKSIYDTREDAIAAAHTLVKETREQPDL
jgi:hypothetical protein